MALNPHYTHPITHPFCLPRTHTTIYPLFFPHSFFVSQSAPPNPPFHSQYNHPPLRPRTSPFTCTRIHEHIYIYTIHTTLPPFSLFIFSLVLCTQLLQLLWTLFLPFYFFSYYYYFFFFLSPYTLVLIRSTFSILCNICECILCCKNVCTYVCIREYNWCGCIYIQIT